MVLKVVKVNSELVNRDGLSLCQVNRKKKKAGKVDCGKSGGREESSFLFHMRLSARLQEIAILKGGKTGRTNKSNGGKRRRGSHMRRYRNKNEHSSKFPNVATSCA